jgi:hypothetical protein
MFKVPKWLAVISAIEHQHVKKILFELLRLRGKRLFAQCPFIEQYHYGGNHIACLVVTHLLGPLDLKYTELQALVWTSVI